MVRVLLDRGVAQSGAAQGRLVVCGFLLSCRKDFTTRVQVAIRVRLLELGTVRQGRASCRRSNGRTEAGLP